MVGPHATPQHMPADPAASANNAANGPGASTSRVRELPRWLARLRAEFGGYFWLSCPVCGRMFGGFEHATSVYADEQGRLLKAGEQPGTFRCVCRLHEAEAATQREGAYLSGAGAGLLPSPGDGEQKSPIGDMLTPTPPDPELQLRLAVKAALDSGMELATLHQIIDWAQDEWFDGTPYPEDRGPKGTRDA